jgi:beta-1,4-mannosyltransferase
MYIYGVFRSFSIRRVGIFKFLLLLLSCIFVTPFRIVVENIAVVWGIVTPKHKFFVVKKALTSEIV